MSNVKSRDLCQFTLLPLYKGRNVNKSCDFTLLTWPIYVTHFLYTPNILAFKDQKNELYVAIEDLGLCRKLNGPNEDVQENGLYGVMPYIAPELLCKLSGSEATTSTDIYSFGMIAYEIASLTMPFAGQPHDIDLALGICKGERPSIPNDTPDYWVKLIRRC